MRNLLIPIVLFIIIDLLDVKTYIGIMLQGLFITTTGLVRLVKLSGNQSIQIRLEISGKKIVWNFLFSIKKFYNFTLELFEMICLIIA